MCLFIKFWPSVGTPSVVTEGRLSTWPELNNLGVFWECNWSHEEASVDSIIEASNIDLKHEEIMRIRNQIVINRNIVKIREML